MNSYPKKSLAPPISNREVIDFNRDGQAKLFTAETTWFHIFRTMISNGDMAKMGPYAFAVYCVIKAHANINTGFSHPSIETIAEKAGISVSEAKRSLDKLSAMGYVSIGKKGRNNNYRLREKIEIIDPDGQAQATAAWDYLPTGVSAAVKDLKGAMESGDFGGARIVHIKHLVVNMNTGSGTQINVDISRINDSPLKKSLQSALAKVLAKGSMTINEPD